MMLVKKNKHGRVLVHIAISVTFISNEAIRNLYVKLYVKLCAVDLCLRTLTILLTALHKFSTTATFVL